MICLVQRSRLSFSLVRCVLVVIALLVCAPENYALADLPLDFNRDIRPILAENCFYCHGQDSNKREGGLRLDHFDDAVQAKAIVPSDPPNSGLIQRINESDADLLMPPPKSNRRLSDEQKKLLERWISEGAKYSKHWAFEAPTRPQEPEVQQTTWVRNPIDRFVLQQLESRGMTPSKEADRATLMKRLFIDLIGLVPDPKDVDAFVNDPDEQAYEKLVDKLLLRTEYGERMALPWLDAARYADSNGFQQDGDTWQWYWRDWVVRALNENMPFDQFTIWQLAGDLLPDATLEQKIASGFNRNHLLNGEGGAIAEEQRFVNLFDRMDTTSTTWLGLTMACAQCHNHKYDPMTQRDYYSMMDAFNQVPESGVPQYFSSRIRVGAPFVEILTDENKARIADLEKQIADLEPESKRWQDAAFEGWKQGLLTDGKPGEGKGLPEPILAILNKPEKDRNDEEKQQLDSLLRKQFQEKVVPTFGDKVPNAVAIKSLRDQLNNYRNDQIARVMIMSDAQKRETSILERGEYLKPSEKVSFNTPEFLPPMPTDSPRNRLGLAKWLVSPEHPLTSRVQANRMWQHFFGQGIVKTTEDFGVQSEYPVHLALLNWLAVEYRDNGWNTKAMHRLILTSATYRQSSRVQANQLAADPENRLYGRASRFRMPSMILRDWALSSSSLLNPKIGGAPVYPYQPEAIWDSLAITKERDFTYPTSQGADLYRRSLYTFWRRTVGPANMFDASNRQSCRVRAGNTSTPLHALTTLNDPTWIEASRKLAERLLGETQDVEQAISRGFKKILLRDIRPSELQKLHAAYQRQLALYREQPAEAEKFLSIGASPREGQWEVSMHAALSTVCLAIYNLDEALCRE